MIIILMILNMLIVLRLISKRSVDINQLKVYKNNYGEDDDGNSYAS